MPRARHPKKQVEQALKYAESRGWTVTPTASGHRWGKVVCDRQPGENCIISVWSTPRDADNHARQIRRAVDNCPHPDTTKED